MRDASRTRAAILEAAVKLFGTRGFANTGVRDVAALAEVNAALVIRYFGSKEGLLREALNQIDISPLLLEDRRRFGANLMATVLSTEDAWSPLGMLMLSASDPAARAVSVDFFETKIIAPLARWLGPPDGDARAERISILWTGFLTTWRLLPIAERNLASTCRWPEAATQAIVDEGEA